MKLNELNLPVIKRGKAGVIPFIRDGEGFKMLFMKSSDPAYGGPNPMIAKGHIDKGEYPPDAAAREAHEELGLRASNMMTKPWLAWEGELSGMDAHYILSVFAVEVKNLEDFDEPHFETGSIHWMTAEEFEQSGRNSQNKIVQAVAKAIAAR